MQRSSLLNILAFSTLFLLGACQQKSEAPVADRSAAPAPPAEQAQAFQDVALNGELYSSSAAVDDSLKKFIRNAEIEFRVQNTAAATLRIEDIVRQNGGFVINSTLKREVERRQTSPISRDSAIETTCFTLRSQMVVRVPCQMLDTTLRSIGKLSEFLEMRHVSAEDVGLQLLEKELTRLREGTYRVELGTAEEGKLKPKADRARDSRATSDQARIETLKLEDQIRYSTLRIEIYQGPQIHRTQVANTVIAAPQMPFLVRSEAALRAGADVILLLFFGILHLWGFILLALLAYAGWKWLGKRKAPAMADLQKSA